MSEAGCKTLEQYREHLTLTSEQLQRIAAEFEDQMKVGLKQEETNLLMLPTMVDVIPDGHETGALYGIEFGGSKLRVVYTKLSEDRHQVDSVQVEESLFPDQQRHCHADELFDYIVKKLMDFTAGIGREISKSDPVLVGFCFSFPVKQDTIKSGKLIKWTKGFENEGAVGKDPVELLTAAFRRQGITANVSALVNDTVGTLCATRYTSGPDANIAVIMGTGTNACYVEQLSNISKWMPKYLARTPDMVVNIEWPGFHSEVIPRMREDAELDQESYNPGDQAFEKLTAGMYMGDVARRVIYSLARSEGWFGQSASQLQDAGSFTTVQLAQISQDKSQGLEATGSVLSAALGIGERDISLDVRKQVQEVCLLVTTRSASLTAAAVVGILRHLERSGSQQGASPRDKRDVPRNIVAVDGGIFAHYHIYRHLVREGVRCISGDSIANQFELKLTEGGAGFGAATVAAAGARYDAVMGRGGNDHPPPRKFPPRRPSQANLAEME